jgi:hypothetical protein
MTGNPVFRCPGHGTAIDLGPAGLFLLHHAYRADDLLDRRRSALLDRIDVGRDGWPVIAGGQGPTLSSPAPLGTAGAAAPTGFVDGFARPSLDPGWEWPFFAPPDARPYRSELRMACRTGRGWPAFVARQVPVDAFTAIADVAVPKAHGLAVGLATHGPGRVLRGVELRNGWLRTFRADDRGVNVGVRMPAAADTRLLLLNVRPDGTIAFYAGRRGGAFARLPGGPAEAGPAPTRTALTCRGTGIARFGSVRVITSGQQDPRMVAAP